MSAPAMKTWNRHADLAAVASQLANARARGCSGLGATARPRSRSSPARTARALFFPQPLLDPLSHDLIRVKDSWLACVFIVGAAPGIRNSARTLEFLRTSLRPLTGSG